MEGGREGEREREEKVGKERGGKGGEWEGPIHPLSLHRLHRDKNLT